MARQLISAFLSVLLLACGLVAATSQNPVDHPLFLIRDKGQVSYIDSEGNVVLKTDFEEASPFSDGRACVLVNGKHGFIDTTGNLVLL